MTRLLSMLFNAHFISLGRWTAGRPVEPLMIARIMLVTLLVFIYSLQNQSKIQCSKTWIKQSCCQCNASLSKCHLSRSFWINNVRNYIFWRQVIGVIPLWVQDNNWIELIAVIVACKYVFSRLVVENDLSAVALLPGMSRNKWTSLSTSPRRSRQPLLASKTATTSFTVWHWVSLNSSFMLVVSCNFSVDLSRSSPEKSQTSANCWWLKSIPFAADGIAPQLRSLQNRSPQSIFFEINFQYPTVQVSFSWRSDKTAYWWRDPKLLSQRSARSIIAGKRFVCSHFA